MLIRSFSLVGVSHPLTRSLRRGPRSPARCYDTRESPGFPRSLPQIKETMPPPPRPPIDDEGTCGRLGQMLVDLNEAERLLTRIQRQAIDLGDDDLVHLLDGELFWKLREGGTSCASTSTWSASTAGTCSPRRAGQGRQARRAGRRQCPPRGVPHGDPPASKTKKSPAHERRLSHRREQRPRQDQGGAEEGQQRRLQPARHAFNRRRGRRRP